MASIINSVRTSGKMFVSLQLSNDEALKLNGYMDSIYLISDSNASVPSRISMRGKNEATKYFLIPKMLRKDLTYDGKVTCQKIENKDKILFVYVVDKIVKY
ncbi:MAG TPA: hypothetical protein VJI69_09330 [Bacteroidia bacterium]|nr:hypothetical protein [Bacteroidia bacterium]